MKDDFCMYCGYMTNGNFIGRKEARPRTDLEKFLGTNYENIIWHGDRRMNLILGPLSFAYRNHFLFSVCCMMVECMWILLWYL